jgi:hypothetical protein
MTKSSDETVAALGAWLFDRDWPNAAPRERHGSRMYQYRCQAAAILAGEAWAIRKAWPEAAYDIATRSDWTTKP